ncbi:MAG: TIGR03790 family protein [Rubrivivax sp.]
MPRSAGRLYAPALGLVINESDPDSVAVGEYYIAARHVSPAQVLRVAVPIKNALTRDEFERLRNLIEVRFGPRIQALALAWTAPYAVECNSITGALALGFDAALCQNSCARSRQSAYFNSPSSRPLTDHSMRPSMLLAAGSVTAAKAMIDRGVAADGTLARTDRAPVTVLLLDTADGARAVRSALYPPAGSLPGLGIDVQRAPESALAAARRVLMVATGSANLNLTPPPDWVPGGLGDHLTSFGGDLLGGTGQSSALEWIASGATASHGAVSEPCNHLQKFPHPQVLLAHYVQGVTAIEAYWKSVAWPQQSLFIGEPLAAPFSKY